MLQEDQSGAAMDQEIEVLQEEYQSVAAKDQVIECCRRSKMKTQCCRRLYSSTEDVLVTVRAIDDC